MASSIVLHFAGEGVSHTEVFTFSVEDFVCFRDGIYTIQDLQIPELQRIELNNLAMMAIKAETGLKMWTYLLEEVISIPLLQLEIKNLVVYDTHGGKHNLKTIPGDIVQVGDDGDHYRISDTGLTATGPEAVRRGHQAFAQGLYIEEEVAIAVIDSDDEDELVLTDLEDDTASMTDYDDFDYENLPDNNDDESDFDDDVPFTIEFKDPRWTHRLFNDEWIAVRSS